MVGLKVLQAFDGHLNVGGKKPLSSKPRLSRGAALKIHLVYLGQVDPREQVILDAQLVHGLRRSIYVGLTC